MRQSCKQIANVIIELLVDDEIGFSDFLYSKKEELIEAIAKHWQFLIALKNEEPDESIHRQMYMDLVVQYSGRQSREISPFIYRAYLELAAYKELNKLPLIHKGHK